PDTRIPLPDDDDDIELSTDVEEFDDPDQQMDILVADILPSFNAVQDNNDQQDHGPHDA
ncbi:hypothetical protein BGX33_001955, partial [Mortierella sp. NVP41]